MRLVVRYLVMVVLLCTLLVRLLRAYSTGTSYLADTQIVVRGEVERAIIDRGQQQATINGITIWAPIYPKLHLADQAQIEGTVYCPNNRAACALRYVIGNDILIEETSGENYLASFLTRSNGLRERVSVAFGSLPTMQRQLLTGIVLGGRDLSREFKGELAGLGLSHVVAASGMNVTFVAGGLLIVLSSLNRHRMVRAIIAGLVIWFYAILTGFDAPIVRAAIMSSGIFFAQAFGRGSSGWWGLIMSGYVMLWVNPAWVSDYSFLLSFTSMMGQLSLSTIDLKLPNGLNLIAQSVLQSLAAVVATLPIVISLSGQFSLVVLLTNALVVWTIEPLMILGGISVIVNPVLPGLARLALLPAEILLNYFLWIVNFFSGLSWRSIQVSDPGMAIVIGYYIFLFGLYLLFVSRRKKDIFDLATDGE